MREDAFSARSVSACGSLRREKCKQDICAFFRTLMACEMRILFGFERSGARHGNEVYAYIER